jgi:hypothetical protein
MAEAEASYAFQDWLPVRAGPFLSHRAAMPPQDGARRDQPVRPQRSGQLPDQRGQHPPVG